MSGWQLNALCARLWNNYELITQTCLSAKSKIVYREFSQDVYSSWILSPMNMTWSLVSVYTLSFFPWLSSSAPGKLLFNSLSSNLQNEEKWEITTLLLGWPAAGLANISRYHNTNVVFYACVHSLSLPCLQQAGCGFARSWLLSLQAPKWWNDLSTSARTAVSLTAWTEN